MAITAIIRDVETMWMCQLNKEPGRKILNKYAESKDKSGHELGSLYCDLVSYLSTTQCWGISGVNKLIAELSETCRKTLTHAKRGKSSARAQAKKILAHLDDKVYGVNSKVVLRRNGRYTNARFLTQTELETLLQMTTE